MKRKEQMKSDFKKQFSVFWTPFWAGVKETPKLYFQPLIFLFKLFKRKEKTKKKVE